MLNKTFLFSLVALVAAPLAFGAAPEPITKTILGVKHKCSRPEVCWSEKDGLLLSVDEKTLVYLNSVEGTFPIVKRAQKNVYQAWVTYVYVPPENGIAKIIALVQVNAKTEQQRILTTAVYDKKGDFLGSIDSPRKWEYVVPGSLGETINAAIIGMWRFTDVYGEENIRKMNVFKAIQQ